MQKLKLDFDSIESIIDETIDNQESVTFICNADIALSIEDYLLEQYDVEDEEATVEYDENQAYIVTIDPSDDDEPCILTLEYFKTNKGVYKKINNTGICYDLSDVDKNIIFEKVDTDELEYCEFVDNEDELEEECDCEFCQREKAYMDYVGEQILQTLEIVSNDKTCDKCKFMALLGLFELGVHGVANGIINPNNFLDED